MKFAYTADWHLSRYGQDKVEDVDNLPERLSSIKSTLYEIADYCRKESIIKIMVGGDLLHNKSVIYTLAQDIMLDFFRNNKDIEFIVIDGNHDLSGKGENVVSALKSLDNEENVTRIQGDHYLDSVNDILYVPYSTRMVEIIKNNSAKYLISHFGLNEAILNSGISVVADIGIKDLVGKYKYVLLGHYHLPQEILSEEIDIHYVGSVIQLDWGEKNETKRFLVVDTEIENIQSIPTTGYKKYIEYEIDSENRSEVIEEARLSKEKGDHVKIIKKEKIDISDVEDEFRIIDKTEKDITNRNLNSSMSLADKLERYLEIAEIDEKYREDYKKTAFEIVDSCSGL